MITTGGKWNSEGKQKQFELARNSSYRGKLQWNFAQNKENLVRVSGELELSRFYCNDSDTIWLNFKNVLTICQLPWANAFLYKYFGFSSLKCSKIRSLATLNNTFGSVVWNLLQENKFMLPTRFEQATIWLVEIDNSKPRRLAVCSGEERGLTSRTAAGNRAYLPVWHKSLNHPQFPRALLYLA